MFRGLGSVSGSATRSLDSVSRDPVLHLETQSLQVRYRIPSQPYEDCLGVRECIVSYYTAVISGLFSQYFDEIFRSATAQYFIVCLCWSLKSQSTFFQSYRDEATASWVINQYFRGVKCLAQGHNMAAVGLEPPTSRSGVRHSTTEPPRSP